MSDDPTHDPTQTLAELLPELPAQLAVLEPRQRRYVVGHALWKFGHYSLRKAAAAAGIEHHQALHDYIRRKEAEEPADEQGRKRLEEAETMAFEAVQHAWRQMNEHLAAGDYDKNSLPVIAGIAFDKLAKSQQVKKPQQSNPLIEEILGKLTSDGGTVSVSVQPNPKAIDVTPEKKRE